MNEAISKIYATPSHELIIEHEQKGQSRATYGAKQLEELSTHLSTKFGKGFDVTNLHNMRRFYEAFQIRETVSLELSWSHYNILSRIEPQNARLRYQKESIQQNWSVRALERQIGTLYYERLLSSKDKAPVEAEAKSNTDTLQDNPSIYDQHQKDASDNPTIGLILCSQTSEAVAKYSILTNNQQLFASKNLPYLPTEAELKQELERERILLQERALEVTP